MTADRTRPARPVPSPGLPRPVVVGVDGSSGSEAAAFEGAHTARQRQAPLRLVRVVSMPSEDPVDERGGGVALHAAALQLEDLRRELAGLLPGVPVTGVLHRDETGRALLEESWGAERLVLGEHTGSPGLGLVPGSLAYRAHAPVLLHRRSPRPSGTVLVGLDGLPGTAALLALAADEAVRRGALLHVLHGRTSRLPDDGRTGRPGEEGTVRSRAEVLDAERNLVEQWVEQVRRDRPRLRTQLEVRPLSAASLLLAAAVGAQLLVLGRPDPHAVTPPTATAETLLLRSPCSVLMVPVTPTSSVPAAAVAGRSARGPVRSDRALVHR